MHIAIDGRPVFAGMSGIGYYAKSLIHALHEADSSDRYSVFSSPNVNGLLPSVRENFQIRPVHSPDPLWEQLHLPTFLTDSGVELYHSPLPVAPVTKVCKYVITIHDVIPRVRPDLTTPQFAELFDRWIEPSLAVADAVITVSEASKRDIVEHLNVPEEKVFVTYQSISPAFAPMSKSEIYDRILNYRVTMPYLLYVGAVEERKNIGNLLKGFKLFLKAYKKDMFLLIVGKATDDKFDVGTRISEHGLDDHVIPVGYVRDEDMPAFYCGAEALVFPSRYEGFGRPIIEAMACGTPVVAGNNSSMPEIAGEAAVLCDVENPENIASAMVKVVKSRKTRKELVERGHLRAKEFSREKHAKATMAVYQEVVKER